MILQKENRTKKAIANGDSGLVSSIDILNPGRVEDIYVGVDINHARVQDLNVKLISPSGKELVLHDNAAQDKSNLQVKYNREVLESFIGEYAGGEWQLKVKNNDEEAIGTLNSWVIGMSCTDTEGDTSNIFLKDNNINGLSSIQYCQLDGLVNGLSLDVSVEHPFIGDLTVTLVAPSGKSITVHDKRGGDRQNLRATFSSATLRNMLGQQSRGEWALVVKDQNVKDKGCLKSWRLNLNIRHNHNLTRIEGINDQIQNLLYRSGINTYSQLVSANKNELKGILRADGFASHDPGTWGLQAHLAATGQWDELTALQDRLIGGEVITSLSKTTTTIKLDDNVMPRRVENATATTRTRVDNSTIRLGNNTTTTRVDNSTIRLGNNTTTTRVDSSTIRLGSNNTSTTTTRLGGSAATIRLGDNATTTRIESDTATIRLGNNIAETKNSDTTTRLGNNITTRRLGGSITTRTVRT